MIATGCVILFFIAGQVLPSMVTIKEEGTCQALLMTTELVSAPAPKPAPSPEEPAPEK